MSTYRAALREAEPFPIAAELVEACLLPDDVLVRRAWEHGLDALELTERRGRLCAGVGAVAEAVAALLLEAAGLDPFAHLVGPGLHGVDLLALTRGGDVLALEVKGTLRAGRVPRLGVRQMSLAWLDPARNPAMQEWELEGADVYGGVAVLDLGARTWRAALTADYERFVPIRSLGELASLDWLND